jgi:hypothetical protein
LSLSSIEEHGYQVSSDDVACNYLNEMRTPTAAALP